MISLAQKFTNNLTKPSMLRNLSRIILDDILLPRIINRTYFCTKHMHISTKLSAGNKQPDLKLLTNRKISTGSRIYAWNKGSKGKSGSDCKPCQSKSPSAPTCNKPAVPCQKKDQTKSASCEKKEPCKKKETSNSCEKKESSSPCAQKPASSCTPAPTPCEANKKESSSPCAKKSSISCTPPPAPCKAQKPPSSCSPPVPSPCEAKKSNNSCAPPPPTACDAKKADVEDELCSWKKKKNNAASTKCNPCGNSKPTANSCGAKTKGKHVHYKTSSKKQSGRIVKTNTKIKPPSAMLLKKTYPPLLGYNNIPLPPVCRPKTENLRNESPIKENKGIKPPSLNQVPKKSFWSILNPKF